MAKAIDTLVKYLGSKNICEFLTDEQCKKIAEDVITGYEIDEDSRSAWLETNKEAMKIIKHCEDETNNDDKDFPFNGSAKVIYPLLAPAVIQMAARLCTHIVQNDQVCKFAVLGPDQDGQKQQLATRMTDFASYSFLLESKVWLKDTHKLCAIVSSWGTAFRQVYFDHRTKRVCDEVLCPEDVIINHNTTSLEKARRITIRSWMTQNELVEMSRAGVFCDIDTDDLEKRHDEQENGDSREIQPNLEILGQFLYIDLDDDGYAEPYKAFVLKSDSELLGLYPAFDLKGLDLDKQTGEIKKIQRKLDIVDFHLIDDPEGKFYSIGLNYLLTHSNKTITSLVRQLLDSGTLSNTQGGFITKAFKTQQKNIKFKMGQFEVLDVKSDVNPQQHIIPLPFKEPSQVLLALLQLLLQAGKEVGFITDTLTGDVEGQNTPATTMLAMVEQGTRAFKPVIQKLYISEKNEFTLWFELNAENLDVGEDGKKYALFNNIQLELVKQDFNLDALTICPVADPTQCSEAHKYAKIKFLGDLLNTPAAAGLNMQAVLMTLLTEMQIPNAQQMIAQPQQPPPDPHLLKVQLDSQKAQMKHQIDMLHVQLAQEKVDNDKLKTQLQGAGIQIQAQNANTQQKLANAAVVKNFDDSQLQHRQISTNQDIAGMKINAEHRKLDIMEKQPNNAPSSKKS